HCILEVEDDRVAVKFARLLQRTLLRAGDVEHRAIGARAKDGDHRESPRNIIASKTTVAALSARAFCRSAETPGASSWPQYSRRRLLPRPRALASPDFRSPAAASRRPAIDRKARHAAET